jgi:outer membrane cobalamin receptor
VGVANFHTNYEINDKSSMVFSLNNAFDTTYERPDGYAQDGRNMLFTFKWKF